MKNMRMDLDSSRRPLCIVFLLSSLFLLGFNCLEMWRYSRKSFKKRRSNRIYGESHKRKSKRLNQMGRKKSDGMHKNGAQDTFTLSYIHPLTHIAHNQIPSRAHWRFNIIERDSFLSLTCKRIDGFGTDAHTHTQKRTQKQNNLGRKPLYYAVSIICVNAHLSRF